MSKKNTDQEKNSILEKKKPKQEKNLKREKKSKQKRFNIYIGLPIRILILVVLIGTFTFFGTKFIGDGLVTTTTYDLSYEEKSNLDYKVYLKKNDYFDNDYLGKDLQYVASLIDYINVDFDYNFNSSDNVDYDYSYYITGTVVATKQDDETAILYQKEYTLLEEQKLTKEDADTFNIKENLDINYNDYNNIINSFKSEYALSLDGKLIVQLHIITNGNYKDFTNSIFNSSVMELTIPLSEQTLDITMDYKEVNNTDTIEEYSNFELINVIYFILGGIFIVLDLIVLHKYFVFTHKLVGKTSNYSKTINKILKEYDRIITNVRNTPDLTDYNLVNVTDFGELIDVSERIEQPILYCEIHKFQKSQFLVINKNIAYQYIVKAVDLGDL
jgi:hypothetical protein